MRVVLLPILLALAGPAAAEGLFEARTIVTGMDMRSRPEGLRRVLGLMLAKASGNPELADDPRLAATDPLPMLASIAYLDRMSDVPTHDEQGTRDRPFDLVARFDPAAIEALLHRWGDAPWPPPRPDLAVDIVITPRRGGPIALRADTAQDERHRAALLAAADRFGLAVRLAAALGPGPAAAGLPRLAGRLRWSDDDAGWVGSWSLAWTGGERRWESRGGGFDAAYRAAVGGAAAILSGHR